MAELLAKLTELGYDLFGAIIPGVILNLFFLAWWYALGGLAPVWSFDTLPELTLDLAHTTADSLRGIDGIVVLIPAVIVFYLSGQLLLWVARSGPRNQSVAKQPFQRTLFALIFHIPKPKQNYDPELDSLFQIVRGKFGPAGTELTWRQFYPVAKNYLAENISHSLVANYQNKYTLHRSVATAGTILFWASIGALLGAMFLDNAATSGPSYGILVLLLGGGLAVAWGFSASYIEYWEMFGNTLVTETYAYLHGPKNDQPEK